MPNRSSHAKHVPQRTCVVCRAKTSKRDLIRFIVVKGSPVYDLKQKLPARGSYVCDDNGCLAKLEKWISRNKKKIKEMN